VTDINPLAPRDQRFGQISHGVEDEVELLDSMIHSVALICRGSREGTLAPAHAPHALWVSAIECESDHAAYVVAGDVDGFGDG